MSIVLSISFAVEFGRAREVMHIQVSLVGHSFIRRFRKNMERQSNVVFRQNLGINDIDINYVCKGGWCVEHILANAATMCHIAMWHK